MNLPNWGLTALGLTFAVAGASPAAAQTVRLERSGPTFHVAVCPRGNPNGTARCFAHQVTDARGNPINGKANPAATPSGYGPADLRAAYGLTNVTASGTPTVAIVDAFAYPNAEADLAVYRSQYGLPACTTSNGCLKIVGQSGGKPPSRVDTGWDQEQALDLDMVSAACPNCHILLVEASSASFSNLWSGVDYAKGQAGVRAVSNSYGNTDSTSYAQYDSHYAGNNVAITVSTGDNGYGAQWPATAPGAVAVGGTSLRAGGGTRGWTETVWNGAGSGCGLGHAKPSWQNGVTDACGGRMEADVSSNADPNTGVAVYGPATRTQSSWGVWGGTSESSPFIAGLFALRNGSINAASSIYSHTSNLNDVTSGSNGTCAVAYYCNAQAGYDGPTGLGTPYGTAAFSN
jgi:subtilase family serine protease